MVKNILAPRYRFWSLTTVLIFLPIVLYIVLAITNGSFLKLPYFAVENLVLTSFRLQQFEFYRLYSSPFIFMDLNETLFNSLATWIIGSYVEDIFGWKIIVVFIGLSGLVGASCSIIFVLIGLYCTSVILDWASSRSEIIVRRVQIIIYFVVMFLFFLFLLSQDRPARIAIYSSTLYVITHIHLGLSTRFHCRKTA
jgi:membrane associated rhomboid family serine protease